MVDWRAGAHVSNYYNAAVNSELIARQMTVLAFHLVKGQGISPKRFHLIGYSLGAHICGFMGRLVKEIEGVAIGRISAIDPASKIFFGYGNDIHLNTNDTDYLDVIHTSGGFNLVTGAVGIYQPIGHVDYYPNGGLKQKGCHYVFGFYCEHFRAVYLYTESILSKSCHFTSTNCPLGVPVQKCGSCSVKNNTCGRMGYFSDKTLARGSHYLLTNSKYPYCVS